MTNSAGFILVVDDDPNNSDLLSRRLRKQGYTVSVAADGDGALKMISELPLDLILLDVIMPGVSGLAVLEAIRRTHSATALPVIMATAIDKTGDIVTAFELGANDYVIKPLDFPVVVARVETQLSLKRAVEQIQRLEHSLAARNRALEKANSRMSQELKSAAKIQASMLPRSVPESSGVAFAWDFRPCDELAGDALGFVELDANRVGIYVLDVSGHGVASALLSVSISRVLSPPMDSASILARAGAGPLTPSEVAGQLNRMFPFDPTTEQYFTLIYGVMDVTSGEFRYASAGHPGPVQAPAIGGARLLEGRGFPIGLGDEECEERTVHLARGDRLYLYSDGVTEATNSDGKQFGIERLLMAASRNRAEPLHDAIVRLRGEVEEWCGDTGVRDDVSILAVEFSNAGCSQGDA